MLVKRKNGAEMWEGAYALAPDEEVLWQGKPASLRIFNWEDLFLIPFSILWCAFVFTFWLGTSREGFSSGQVILLPHTLVGLYMLFGRFIVKFIGKLHTEYMLTNTRAIIIHTFLGRRVQSLYLGDMAEIELRHIVGETGSIIFRSARRRWWQPRVRYYNNAGLGNTEPGFYDIHEVEAVHQCLVAYATASRQQMQWQVSSVS